MRKSHVQLLSLLPFVFAAASAQQCFQTTAELRAAVVAYDPKNSTSQVALTYGFPIANWCVKNVTSFAFVFQNMTSFNEPLTNWDTSSSTTFDSMFSGAKAFNQPVAHFDV
jgi:hypothetical protein